MDRTSPNNEPKRMLPESRRRPRTPHPASSTWLIAGVVIAALVVATLAGVGLARHGAFQQLASHLLAGTPTAKPSPVAHPSAGAAPVMPPGNGSGSNPGNGPIPPPTTLDVTAGPGASGGSFSLSGNWTRSTSDGGNPGSTTYWTVQPSARATWTLTGGGHTGPFSVSIYVPDRFAGAQGHYQVHDANGTFDVTLDQEELTGWYRVQHTFTANANTQVSVTLTYAGASSHPGDPGCPGGRCTELAVNQVRFQSA